ncbi:3-keto-5-aminohexanoate cleavage protein [Halosegnis sp.]|uniref:3-keto-5-aminohexanoate cleavage protein n=1 Tax=Halosegnis sp. TaxID=2864959 RepID=UPI0035D4DD47
MSYETYLAGEPVIITAALTGGVHGKEANPAIPEAPEEIAAAAEACEAAGASVVHLHARDEHGERAFSRERFQALTRSVRERTDLVVQHSTGGTGAPDDSRHEPLRTDPAPDMASLDMGPLNRYDRLTSENTRGLIDSLATEMAERGIKPEMELFNSGHITEARRLIEEGPLEPPYYGTLIFGNGTLTRPTPGNFLASVRDLPEETLFNTVGFGPHQLPFTAMGLIFGGHVRVGLEDNVYYRRGELATSNAQLVERAAKLAETLERPVATPAEAREILEL